MSFQRILFPFLLAFVLAGVSGSASAAVIEASASPFTGDPLSVAITIDDEADPGRLVVTLEVEGSSPIGDLRGFFAQVSEESLLAGLSVSGSGISNATFSANDVINLGAGNNLNGAGSPCPCDLGFEIGTAGIGSDDIQSITFTLSHATESIDASLLNEQLLGVRATSVGAPDGGRGGSSKLVAFVPEPSAALLLGMSLAALAASRRF